MATGLIFSGGGGTGSDECTATKEQVLDGYTAVTKDSDDEAAGGSMTNRGAINASVGVGGTYTVEKGFHNGSGKVTGPTLSGNASAAHVLKSETFYSNSGTKQTGSMEVASLTSFSAAVSSGKKITLTWTNPSNVAGRPFSGVIVRYGTSQPTSTSAGTLIYMGAGNNTGAGKTSSVTVTLPNLGTKYYFSAWAYATCSAGSSYNSQKVLISGTRKDASATTASTYYTAITGNYTVPAGYTATIYLIGGGGGGAGGDVNSTQSYHIAAGGNAGAGGFITTVPDVKEGTSISSVVIGSGGLRSNAVNLFADNVPVADGEPTLGAFISWTGSVPGANSGGNTSCKIGSTTHTANGGPGGMQQHMTGGWEWYGGNWTNGDYDAKGYTTGGRGAVADYQAKVTRNATSGGTGLALNGKYAGSSGGGGGAYILVSGYESYRAANGAGGSGAGNGGIVTAYDGPAGTATATAATKPTGYGCGGGGQGVAQSSSSYNNIPNGWSSSGSNGAIIAYLH